MVIYIVYSRYLHMGCSLRLRVPDPPHQHITSSLLYINVYNTATYLLLIQYNNEQRYFSLIISLQY